MPSQTILNNLELSLRILEYIEAHQDDPVLTLEQALRENRVSDSGIGIEFGGSGGCRLADIRKFLNQDINMVFSSLCVNGLVAYEASVVYTARPPVEVSRSAYETVCGVRAHDRVYLTNLGEEFLKKYRQN